MVVYCQNVADPITIKTTSTADLKDPQRDFDLVAFKITTIQTLANL